MPYIVLVYGLLIFLGGIIGHAKAGSQASLVMGAIFGSLLLLAAGGMFSKKYFKKSTFFALILALVLDAFFSYRYMSTLKFMPSGMLALVSLGVIIGLVSHLRRNSK
jgi:uncharacterized membrane protein (UPF0136 family)